MSTPDLRAPQAPPPSTDDAWPNPYGAPARPPVAPANPAPVHPAPMHPAPGYPAPGYPAGGYAAPRYPAPGWAPQAAPDPGPEPAHPAWGPGPALGYPLATPADHGASTGLGVAGLVLGCSALALLGSMAGVLSAVVGVIGIVLGSLALRRSRRPRPAGRGVAVAGVVTSAAAVLLAGPVFVVSGTAAGEALRSDLGFFTGGGYDIPLVALRPGEPATVGDYTVTVDEIQMDADAALAANPRNPPAEGRYVQVVVTVVYEGAKYGVVEDDLLVSYAGSSDDWFYDEWSCAAGTDRPAYDVGRLDPGEQATFAVCMDVPVDVLGEAAVIVEDFTAWEDVTVELWGER